jgi:1-acyl-sn-glycerol-3-phosphate acyltransferase
MGAFFRGFISIPLQLTSRVLLWFWGWKPLGTPPAEPKYVLLAAPHTSNWDAVVMLTLACYFRVRVHWMVKSSVFVGPLGWFLKATGGVPIDRSEAHGVVEQMIEQFRQRERFVLLIPPEGTRSKRDYWKSGFYHIALGADVPIVSGVMDWGRKESGFADVFTPTGHVQTDMDHLRAVYATAIGLHPELYTSCRLREEDREPMIGSRTA